MERIGSKVKSSVWMKTGGRCWYCGTEMIPFSSAKPAFETNKDFCVDHAVPRNRGGGNELENLVPACWTCNNRKRDKTVEEFRELISDYHHLASTIEIVEHRKKRGDNCVLVRLVFYFETLETSDEEKLKQGADKIFYFRDPSYLTKNDDKAWRRYERERGRRY